MVKIVKTYRLDPQLVDRVHSAAVWTGVSDSDIIRMAANEYLRKIEKQKKKELEGVGQ